MTPEPPIVLDESLAVIFVTCGCGRIFQDEGVGVTNRYREWVDQHPCVVREYREMSRHDPRSPAR